MDKNEVTQGFARRLNEALDDVPGMPKGEGRQGALGNMFGVSQVAARKWLVGDSIPETWRVIVIVNDLKVSMEWLLTGKGPKYPINSLGDLDALTAIQRRYQAASSETKAIIELALELPFTAPLPKSISPTLKTLIDGARMMAAQNLPKA